jgi:hypothetical protein
MRCLLPFTRSKDVKFVMLGSTLNFELDVGYIAAGFSGFPQSRKANSR